MILAQTGIPFAASFYGFATSKTVGVTILNQDGTTKVARTTTGISEVDMTANSISVPVYEAAALGPVSAAGLYTLVADDGTNAKPEQLVVSNAAYIDRRAFEAGQAVIDGGQTQVTGSLVNMDLGGEASTRASADASLQAQITALGPALLPSLAYAPLIGAGDLSGWVQSQPTWDHQAAATAATLAANTAPVVLTDTTSAGFTLKAPTAPTERNYFIIMDSTGQWATHNLTFDPNGKNLDGSASTVTLSTANGILWIYYNGTQWKTVIKR